jgi:DNA-binding NarL/FixJ family response regulator
MLCGLSSWVRPPMFPRKVLRMSCSPPFGRRWAEAATLPAPAEKLAAALSSEVPVAPHETLSNRELEVLRLVAAGKTIKEVAAELHLSEKTIATYRIRLSKKMNLSTNVELARYALQHNLAD